MYSLIPEKPLRLVYEPWNDAIRHIFTDISTLTEPKQGSKLHIRETQIANVPVYANSEQKDR